LPASGRWILWFAHVLVGEPASTSPEHALAIEYLPPASSGGRSSHKSETRISAIADFARKGKREKKALPLSLLTDLRHDNHRAMEKASMTSATHQDGLPNVREWGCGGASGADFEHSPRLKRYDSEAAQRVERHTPPSSC
jgi:hypothetical protein